MIPDKEFEVAITARARNGALWKAVEKLGSQTALARHLGICPSELGSWLNFKSVPAFRKKRSRDYDAIEKKLFELTGLFLEDIFPEELSDKRFLELEKQTTQLLSMPRSKLIEAGAVPALPAAPDAAIIAEELKKRLEDQLGTLTAREESVVKMRFGLTADGRERTLSEIGEHFSVTQERIRQIEAKALRKLRHPQRAEKLSEIYDEIRFG